ncbi:MAG: hypothetical protein KGI33_11610 [Thaumarchaeota archaeon]|nr:hypothetical protein [Nitrososphaerota archaeon]
METGDDKFYRAILNVLNDEQSMRIILCASKNAKSMNEMIQETNIARTTIHRKINSMVREGLLFVENFTISRDGKKSMLFRGRISNIEIRHDGKNLMIMIEENPGGRSKILARSSQNETGKPRPENSTEPLSGVKGDLAVHYL